MVKAMSIQLLELTLEGYDDKDVRLMSLLQSRIFHSTSETGYHGIVETEVRNGLTLLDH